MILITLYFALILLLSIISLSNSGARINPLTEKTKGLTVVIPYKNEMLRIKPLVNSLNGADIPDDIEFIFVDDHSEDKTAEFLLSELDIRFRLLRLRTTGGKKQAIKYAVRKANYKQILTLDADVNFKPDFFRKISSLPLADLTILPVKMVGKTLFQKLNVIEFKWLQTITYLSARFNKPVLCNGANLKFSKAKFLETEKVRKDDHILSGDDIFLLQAIQNSEGYINAFENTDLAVSTDAPGTIKDLLNQRIRWISKLNSFSGIIGVVIILSSNIFLLYALLQLNQSAIWLVPVLLKIGSEWLGTHSITIGTLVLVILHQLYYPLYGLGMLIYWPFKRNW